MEQIHQSGIAKNVKTLRSMPREVCFNSSLLLGALFYSLAAVTVSMLPIPFVFSFCIPRSV